MEVFSQCKSVRNFSDKELSEQELANLLWAAMGQNRADGKLTSPSCRNFQEIRLFVFGNMDERLKMMASVEAGIVSENISVAFAGLGLATVPRATMKSDEIIKLLNLPDNHIFCEGGKPMTAFGDDCLLFRVCNKIFACMIHDVSNIIDLKCDPDYAIELRDLYSVIEPAWHWNKKYWNQMNVEP